MRVRNDAKWFFRFFFQNLLFLHLLASVALGCGGSQGQKSNAAAELPKRPQIPTDPTLLLPKECFGAAFVDVEAIRRSKLIDPQSAMDDGQLSAAQRRLADYLYEHAATAALCLAKVGENGREGQDAAVILRGVFDLATLEGLTKELSSGQSGKNREVATAKEYRGYQQLFLSDQAQALLLDERTLLVASLSLTPSVLAAAEGVESARFVGSELYRKLNNYAGFGQCTLCGAMVLPEKVKNRVTRRSSSNSLLRKYVEIVNGITTAGLRIDLKTELDAALVLETSSPDHPAVLGEALKGMVMIGKFVYQDRDFSAVADNLKVSSEGLIVRIKTHATLKQATHLITLFKNALASRPASN
jgi:hypothetical protein